MNKVSFFSYIKVKVYFLWYLGVIRVQFCFEVFLIIGDKSIDVFVMIVLYLVEFLDINNYFFGK